MDVVYNTKNYYVDTGASAMEDYHSPVYRCINKRTGIVEAEEQMLPRILEFADQLSEKQDELVNEGADLFGDGKESTTPYTTQLQ